MMIDEIDLIAIFRNQVASEIRRATESVLELEKNPEEKNLVNSIMREFHTIKGAARAIQFDEIKNTAHLIENIYHALLEGKINFQKSLIDLTLYTIDLINEMLEARISNKSFPDCENLKILVDSYLAGQEIQVPKNQHIEKEKEGLKQNFCLEANNRTDSEETKTANSENIRDKDDQVCENIDKQQTKTFDDKEILVDKLLNLSGEISVAVSSLDLQRLAMGKVASGLEFLSKDLIRLLKNTKDVNLFSDVIIERLRDLKAYQKEVMSILDLTQNRLHFLSGELDHEVTQSRLVPLDTLFSTFPRIARDLSQELGKSCEIVISGQDTRIDRGVLDAIRIPMLHIIRNALDHGIESADIRKKSNKNLSGCIEITAIPFSSSIHITITDDGAGINLDKVKDKVLSRGDTTEELWNLMSQQEREQFLFLPGISTARSVSETSGRGMGLDIVKTHVEKVGGRVKLISKKGKGTAFILELPMTLSLERCVLIKAGIHEFFGVQYYAFSQSDIEKVYRVGSNDLRTVNGRHAVRINDETFMLYDFATMMGLKHINHNVEQKHLLLLNIDNQRIGILVEEIFDEYYIVSRRINTHLGKIRDVEGITFLRDGKMALIVDAKDLILTLSEHDSKSSDILQHISKQSSPEQKKQKILVVEDSQTVREVEKHFLESAGYDVTTAVNGADGLNKLKSGQFDVIISDIDMPRMNGIEMVREIKKDQRLQYIPIIIVSYKDREEDRIAAKDVGVNLYITKAAFDSQEMLGHIKNFIGA